MPPGESMSGRAKKSAPLHDIFVAHRHAPVFSAMLVAAFCLPFALAFAPLMAIPATASAFFLTYLLLMARRMPRLTAEHLKAHAENDDAPALAIIGVTLLSVAVALVSLFLALNRSGSEQSGVAGLVLDFASVILGWSTIHTMAALHYARLYWQPQEQSTGGKQIRRAPPRRGLEFPGTPDPCGYDFLYFSFVIGMTAQTSDTALTSTPMRKANLAHAVVSFFFNTVLVAAAVNAAVSLAT